MYISHFRLGDDPTEYSTSNVIVKESVVSGGFFELWPIVSGRYLTIRRDEPIPDSIEPDRTLEQR